MVQAAQAGIEVFARSIIRSESEIFFALDSDGSPVLATGDALISRGSVQREIARPVEFDTTLPVLTPLF